MKRILVKLFIFTSAILNFNCALAQDAQSAQQLQQLLQAARQQAQQPQTVTTTTTTQSAALPTPPSTPPAPGAAQQTTTTTSTLPSATAITAGIDVGADVRDEAFAAMTQTQLPLTPDQIRTLRHLYDQTQRAAAEYPGVPPRPTSSSLVVNLSPGAMPPIIRLLSGFVTSLVFIDSTGAPWPIKAYDIGDPGAFDIKWDEKSNTLLVQSITQYKQANLAVQLVGLNTPVMITLQPGQAAVDYRVDLHVPGIGPLAFPIINGLPPAASPLLLNVLSGIPPAGSRTLQIIPAGYADVWMYRGVLYVRTPATILSPAWIATMSSSDGTHAYKMPITPMIMISQNGKPINLMVRGY